ncbi:MAG: clostripain-related cysteine peptidase [Planctomycetota bacterium]
MMLSTLASVLFLVSQADADRPWTLLIYGAADNNADGPILGFLGGVRTAINDDPGFEIILFLDRSDKYSTDKQSLGEDFTGARLYRVRRDRAERLAGDEEFPEITLQSEYEANSADPENLRKFIAFGKAHFPAQHYALIIYSHADGRTMCPDESAGADMGIAQVSDVLTEEESVDFLGLELCNMGGIEVAYQWRPAPGRFGADVLLAIPNAGPPLDWNRIFDRCHTPGHVDAGERTIDPAKLSAEQLGILAIEEGYAGRRNAQKQHPDREASNFESAGCYDLRRAQEVKDAVDAFARELAKANAKEIMKELRGPGPRGIAMNYVHDDLTDRPYVDLHDLLRRATQCAELTAGARDAAAAAMTKVDAFVLASFAMDGYRGFEPGKNGVFIVFPIGDEPVPQVFGSPSRRWRQFLWYTPNAGDPKSKIYGSWAWCRDGAKPDDGIVENWFELLDCWFDDPAAGAGGCNRYVW